MSDCLITPRVIGIELARGCNSSCLTRPVTAHASDEQQRLQFIHLDLLAQLAEEIDRWPTIETIWLFPFGEPLAHPWYRVCLEILRRSQVARSALVIQHTNASLLEGDRAEAILEVPLIKKLVFSFDGFGDCESYEKLWGPNFDRVLGNIEQFASRAYQRRPDLKLATCTILPRQEEVPGLSLPQPEEAIARLNSVFGPLGIEVESRNMHSYGGNDALRVNGRKPAVFGGGCPLVESNLLYLTVNGRCQPCCANHAEAPSVGRFPKRSFGELINSPKMRALRRRLRLDARHELPFCKNCSLSLAELGTDGLRQFWKADDDRGELADITERRRLFGEVVPTPHGVIRLDLGCGRAKSPGFLGADRFPLPDVDIVLDMNKPFPLADNSVDLLLASHSLEHVDDLIFTMQEVFRICKDRAQVCILAPYYAQGLNLANPYHKQCFNEHTPRFWTNVCSSGITKADYGHPHAPQWGLSENDHSSPGIDLRCLRMEFFYFPQYRKLPEEEKRTARHRLFDVCDQVMYHLLVVKSAITEEEIGELSRTMEFYQPPVILSRRERDAAELQAELEASQLAETSVLSQVDSDSTLPLAAGDTISGTVGETAEASENATPAVQPDECNDADPEIEGKVQRSDDTVFCENHVEYVGPPASIGANSSRDDDLTVAIEDVGVFPRNLLASPDQPIQIGAPLDDFVSVDSESNCTVLGDLWFAEDCQPVNEEPSTPAPVPAIEPESPAPGPNTRAKKKGLQALQTPLASPLAASDPSRKTAESLLHELNGFRQRRIICWINRLRDRHDLQHDIRPAMQQLRDDSLLFQRDMRGFRLQASDGLSRMGCLDYAMELAGPELTGLLLAPVIDLAPTQGALSIEILCPCGKRLAESHVPAASLDPTVPTRFDFASPVCTQDGGLRLRVRAPEVDVPLRLLEWRRYRWRGVGTIERKAFCGLLVHAPGNGGP
jgi:hypothetical protein